MRHYDGDDLVKHLDDFYTLWIRIQKRYKGSSHSVAKAMKPIF